MGLNCDVAEPGAFAGSAARILGSAMTMMDKITKMVFMGSFKLEDWFKTVDWSKPEAESTAAGSSSRARAVAAVFEAN